MPNIVFIDCHDLGRHLGVYGRDTVPSPHLDILAERGICFERSFCTAPQCSPSRAGLFTGRYAHANGMFGLAHEPFNWSLNPHEIHLARRFQNAGYRTALIGVQHVTSHDESAVRRLGFDHVQLETDALEIPGQIRTYLSDGGQSPFFLNIGFMIPHRDPVGHYHQAPPDNSLGVSVPGYLPDSDDVRDEFVQLQGVIRQLDDAVGGIWSVLDELGLLDDTWIIFTTDHGLAMPRAKCTLFDPGIETALIMYAPGLGLTGGTRYPQLISNVDIVPTIIEMLDLSQPENLHGRSFAPLLRNESYQPRREIFAEKTFHTAYEPQRAVRTERFKLIWNAEAGIITVPGDVRQSPAYPRMLDELTTERPVFEFYDLEQDPVELENRIQGLEYAREAEALRQVLLDWMQDTGDPLLKGPISSPFYDQSLQQLTRRSM